VNARRVLCLTALSLVSLSGCGSLGSNEVTERVQAPEVLSAKQTQRWPAGAPARVVFEWWRALQFDNATVAARYYAKSLKITPAELDGQLRLGANPLGLDRRPRLVGVDRHGDRATVDVMLEGSTVNPNGRVDVERVARGFNLVREDGEWRLAENLYLSGRVRLVLALRGQSRQQSKP
jgi:hypothetical protein